MSKNLNLEENLDTQISHKIAISSTGIMSGLFKEMMAKSPNIFKELVTKRVAATRKEIYRFHRLFVTFQTNLPALFSNGSFKPGKDGPLTSTSQKGSFKEVPE